MKFRKLEIMEIDSKNSKIRFKYEMEFCLQTACFHKSFAVISFLKESFDFFSSSNTDKRRTSLWDRKQAHFGVLQEARAFGKEDPARHPATRIDSGKGRIPEIWYGFLSSSWRCVKIQYNSKPCMKRIYSYIRIWMYVTDINKERERYSKGQILKKPRKLLELWQAILSKKTSAQGLQLSWVLLAVSLKLMFFTKKIY